MISLWDLLFHPGLYAYADQHFPLSTAIPASSITSLSPMNGFSFDRLFLTWPYFLLTPFTGNIAIIEKGFLYYTFLIYSAMCFLFAYIMVNYYSEYVKPLTTLKKNGSILVIFILAYSNLSALNLNADGGTWADSIILLMIAISVVLILKEDRKMNAYLPITGMMMLSSLLDPDYMPMFWIAIFVVSLFKSIAVGNIRAVSYSILSMAVSAFSIFYLYLQSSLTGSLSLSGFNALGYRTYSASGLAFDSGNINFYNVFILFGHLWSTIVYAPPSILSIKNIFDLSSLYSPAQVLIVPGTLFYLWIIALASVPFFAFLSLLFKSTRKQAIPFFSLFVVAYLITEEWNIRVIYEAIYRFTELPIFGSAIGTAFSLPGHFLNLMAFAYLPLFSLGIITIIHHSDKIHVHSIMDENGTGIILKIENAIRMPIKKGDRVKTLVVIIIITSLVSLAGWQAFSGSYYPMRDSPGSFLEGNSVDPKGAFSPTEINGSVIHAYNLVASNYTQGYNSIWIGGPSINEFTYSGPQNSVSESGLSYLTSNNLTIDLKPYLVAHSVKYVVVSGQDIASTVPNPFSAYGFSNYTEANEFFSISGLDNIYSGWNVSVYEVPGVNNYLYGSNLLINTTGIGSIDSTLYGIFNTLDFNASMSGEGIATGIGNKSDSIDVVSPSELAFSGVSLPTYSMVGKAINSAYYAIYANSTSYHGYKDYYQNNSLGQHTDYLPGNFTTTDWGGNSTFIYSNGSIIASGKNASFSLDYNNAMTGGPGGVYIKNHNVSITMQFRFNASVSDSYTGSNLLNIIGEGENASRVTFFMGYPLNVTNRMKQFEFNATFPSGTAYVGFRIGFYGYSGTVDIRYANLTISPSTVPQSKTPFGDVLNLSNSKLVLPNGFRAGYIIYKNSNGTLMHSYFSGNVTHFNGTLLAVILIKNYSLIQYEGKYAVINQGVTRAYRVVANGKDLTTYYAGQDGSYIYAVDDPANVSIIIHQSYVWELWGVYSALVILALSLILLRFKKGRFLHFLKNELFGNIKRRTLKLQGKSETIKKQD